MKKKKFNSELTLSPNMQEAMKPLLDYFEVEILQGETETFPDGEKQYRFNASEEKMALVRQTLWKWDMRNNIES